MERLNKKELLTGFKDAFNPCLKCPYRHAVTLCDKDDICISRQIFKQVTDLIIEGRD